MALPKQYHAATAEPRLLAFWQEQGIYHFARDDARPVFSIDTPPPTVSGNLHLGHVYSYSHTDFIARFRRMNGDNVFYPMGFDDNGLPTELLVERRLGITAEQVGRSAFIERCLEVSEEAEKDYRALWQRLGLSIDWRYSYRTIDELSRKTSQRSFIDLYNKGFAYRRQAPAIWCPHCHTAIAQAEVNDLERESLFVTIPFERENGGTLEIATTRAELLPACVAVFVHPDDKRYWNIIGSRVRVPLFGQLVPVLADPGANPEKGTGAVMCCTFGDTADVEWWYTHELPLEVAIDREGRMTDLAGPFSGLPVAEARREIIKTLEENNLVLDKRPVEQTVRVHERCDTPVEYIVTNQWFIRVLDRKDELLAAGDAVVWHPDHMEGRYVEWVSDLKWDWCISRQRYFGVPFPVWYCSACGEVVLADPADLPVDPLDQEPSQPCACGNSTFLPENDVMDTWATSSMSPQIVGKRLSDPALYDKVFPMSLRPQAHEIIRTWAFYTIVKNLFDFGAIPWKETMISGWGLAAQGAGKISKSRGGGPMAPMAMIEKYSADATRYWAASTGLGKDSVISEEKIQIGAKLVTKLWNVAVFSQRFLQDYRPPEQLPQLSPADRWILSVLQRLVGRVTDLLANYDYAAAKSEIENFFWSHLTDNYLEMAKQRLYDAENPLHSGGRYTLYTVLLTIVKLFAPFLPYVTEEIYQGLFAEIEGKPSVHLSSWSKVDDSLLSEAAEELGYLLVEIATAVRRYKSEHNLALGSQLQQLQLATQNPDLAAALQSAAPDLMSITRAQTITTAAHLDPALQIVQPEEPVGVALQP